jgi:archaetidylinositol phosphate synthase
MLEILRDKSRFMKVALARPFVMMRFHPDVVSALCIPFGMIYIYFMLKEQYLLAAASALIAATMDFIDGTVAELTGKKSYFGNYFDAMMDKYLLAIIFIPLVLKWPLAGVLAFAFSFLESYAKPRVALVIITDNRDWPSIGGHADKLVIIVTGLALQGLFPQIRIGSLQIMEATLYLLATVTCVGTIQRMLYAKRLVEEAEKKGKILPYLKKNAGHKAVE